MHSNKRRSLKKVLCNFSHTQSKEINNAYKTRSFKEGEAALRETACPRGEIAPRPDLSQTLRERSGLASCKETSKHGPLRTNA